MSALSASLILTAVAPVVLLLAGGFILRKRGVVDDGLRLGLMNLVISVFFPALVLAKVSKNVALQNNAVAFLAPAAGFASLLIGYAVSRVFAKACGADTPERRRAFVYTTGNYNYGYLAIPMCGAIYGEESVAVLLLFNVGLELCFWSVGAALLTGGVAKDIGRRIVNPITVAMVVALIINRAGVTPHLPDWFFKTTEMLGACGIPCGILLVGMGIPALISGFRANHDLRISIGAILLRNGLIPALFVAGGLFMPLPTEVSRLLLLQAAMPAALFPIVMCQHYGVAPQVSLRVAVATTLAGVVTIPGWLWIGPWLMAQVG
jgi:predicted permease